MVRYFTNSSVSLWQAIYSWYLEEQCPIVVSLVHSAGIWFGGFLILTGKLENRWELILNYTTFIQLINIGHKYHYVKSPVLQTLSKFIYIIWRNSLPKDHKKYVPVHRIRKFDNTRRIHMTGASTNRKKLTLKKDLTCIIDCVKLKPFFVFSLVTIRAFFGTFGPFLSYFWSWCKIQKLFWHLPM